MCDWCGLATHQEFSDCLSMAGRGLMLRPRAGPRAAS